MSFAYGSDSAAKLKDLGADITFKTYPTMGHEVRSRHACLGSISMIAPAW